MTLLSPDAPPALDLPAELCAAGYSLRPETESDIPFLLALYASTREEELAPVPWPSEVKQGFLASQFQAQRHHYYNYIPNCAFWVIEERGAPVGRLYLERSATLLRIVDIALIPGRRGAGVGGRILQAIQAAAEAEGRGVGIMVDIHGRAQGLYRRLGFVQVADHGLHLEMIWPPEQA